jgi:uncharacterized protein (DUF2235 family)
MARNIVFCADGTWSGPDVDEDQDGGPGLTNVLKLFAMLEGDDTWPTIRLRDEQERFLGQREGRRAQVAKYIHGLGDPGNPIVPLLGGGFGAGVIARIVRGYTFVSREYTCPEDRIVLVGFSRGASTVRALAALICDMGLLRHGTDDPKDKAAAYRLGIRAWCTHRAQLASRQPLSLRERVQATLAALPDFAREPVSPEQLTPVPAIDSVAVWDTVGKFGIPAMDERTGERADVYRFADTVLHPKVRHGFHAVSIDEQRGGFEPTLWTARENVVQCLFAGSHADVGGGHPAAAIESGLSDIALVWMAEQLKRREVIFSHPMPRGINPDPRGTAHEPWAQGEFAGRPAAPRCFDGAHVQVHRSVRERKAALGYEPANVPAGAIWL